MGKGHYSVMSQQKDGALEVFTITPWFVSKSSIPGPDFLSFYFIKPGNLLEYVLNFTLVRHNIKWQNDDTNSVIVCSEFTASYSKPEKFGLYVSAKLILLMLHFLVSWDSSCGTSKTFVITCVSSNG